MESNKLRTGRRGFLLGAGAAAGAAGVAVVAGKQAGEPVGAKVAKPDTKDRGGGYHVTDHVRSYYRSTLV
jgi:hypothetical protein